MSAITGRRGLGLYKNGCGEYGTNENFTYTQWYTGDGVSGDGCFLINFDTTSGWQSNEFVPVDTSKYYYHSVSVKTYARSGTTNRLSGGHIGFACYDKYKNFIDLRNCGDIGNTTLTRPANPGDTKIYIASASNWYTGADVTNYTYYFRQILFFPATHPDYGQPWKYTRFNGMRYKSLVQTAQGDWEMTLENGTMPDYGYPMPAGTPISRGVAGGSYNYCHGAPNYPDNEWVTYTTGAFTGENRNSSTPFRYATAYIRFLNLTNYNIRSDSGRPRPRPMFDNIMLVQAKPPSTQVSETYKPIKSHFFNRSKLKWVRGQNRKIHKSK